LCISCRAGNEFCVGIASLDEYITSNSSMSRPSHASISSTYIFVVAGKKFHEIEKMLEKVNKVVENN